MSGEERPEAQWFFLGKSDYGAALKLQKNLLKARQCDEVVDTVLFLEHNHVYTVGCRPGSEDHLLVGREALSEKGAALHYADRGGSVTYHGYGQLIGYYIFYLGNYGRDVHRFVYMVEELLIRLLEGFGIEGSRDKVNPGVWVGKEKIAAIGMGVKRWVSYHGFALNVDPDLSYYDYIVPCGLRDRGVTSMHKYLGEQTPSLDTVVSAITSILPRVFYCNLSRGEVGALAKWREP